MYVNRCTNCDSTSIIKVYTNIEVYWCEHCGTLYYKNYFSTDKLVKKVPLSLIKKGEPQTTWYE